MNLRKNAAERNFIIKELKEEVIGPAPAGNELNCKQPIIFETFDDTKNAFKETGTGEEIINRGNAPLNRYGAAILYPFDSSNETEVKNVGSALEDFDKNSTGQIIFGSNGQSRELENSLASSESNNLQNGFDSLAAANHKYPSSMGLSLTVRLEPDEELLIKASGGRYRKLPVIIKEREEKKLVDNIEQTVKIPKKRLTWWKRESVLLEAKVSGRELLENTEIFKAKLVNEVNTKELDLSLEVISRPQKKKNEYLVTVVLVNRTNVFPGQTRDECSLFQSRFEVTIPKVTKLLENKDKTSMLGELESCNNFFDSKEYLSNKAQIKAGSINVIAGMNSFNQTSLRGKTNSLDTSSRYLQNNCFLPNKLPTRRQLSAEEKSNELLYRKSQAYAVGFGCSADWEKENASILSSAISKEVSDSDGQAKQGNQKIVTKIIATHFPVYEVPRMTTDIIDGNGNPIKISMAKLAGLVQDDDGTADLKLMLSEYEEWIKRQAEEIEDLEGEYKETAHRHIANCRKKLRRMQEGFRFINTDEKAKQAFRFANHAILIQQYRSKQELRQPAFKGKSDRTFYEKTNDLDFAEQKTLGNWRGFQIAFLLLSVKSAALGKDLDRKTVELIWFPTGGGKTESYLGLAAFSLFYRRLSNPFDEGTHIFMRYTLRLLTTQQFQRAGALICAMEYLRRQNPYELGDKEISLGLWLGNEVTPGTRSDAVNILRKLKDESENTANKFVLNRCPWCAARLGKIGQVSKKGKHTSENFRIIGYEERNGTAVLHCPDETCDYHEKLPIYVVDEDIYNEPPSMFIATVDKFAVLAWKTEARSLFGIDENGKRFTAPPGLIIQDELHLISGPLGTMVGLFEPLVEHLCTDFSNPDKPTLPKIVCATATTRHYREQVKGLFGRTKTEILPPPGLDASDSFFSKYAVDEKGEPLPGKKYVGISAPGLRSLQSAETRVHNSLIQSAPKLSEEVRDNYWTHFVFYNSLKMLGNAVPLFESIINVYRMTYQNRTGLKNSRKVYTPIQLTGRRSSDEIPVILSKLETGLFNNDGFRAVDVCLASSIAEVGVDVPRLGYGVIVGQPTSNAQYIQITGRPGRNPAFPGLIVTIYNPNSSRDSSYFEQFRSFHEQLYSKVEPLSVTPFSVTTMERGIHAVMIAFVRQIGNKRQTASPYPVPEKLLQELKQILQKRVEIISPEMKHDFERIFEKRINEWKRRACVSWTRNYREPDTGDYLMKPYDRWTDHTFSNEIWMVLTSMRSVDAEAEFIVTDFYQREIKSEIRN